MWELPSRISSDIRDFAEQLGCEWIGAVPVNYRAVYEFNDCHNSCIEQVKIFGGKRRIGYYFVQGFGTIQAIYHSVWENPLGELIDIVPYQDRREYNIFSMLPEDSKIDYHIPSCYFHNLHEYLEGNQEVQMYYVYKLIDPRNNMPFYIGKDKHGREERHLKPIPDTRDVYKENKIKSIRADCFEPEIVYIAENIIDEQLACDIKTQLIKEYKNKGLRLREITETEEETLDVESIK